MIYIEPYPKSLAAELYPDSISVESGRRDEEVLFEPFVGIAPRQYMQLFEMGTRKDRNGKAIPFDEAKANMRYSASEILYIDEEDLAIQQLSTTLNEGLLFGGRDA